MNRAADLHFDKVIAAIRAGVFVAADHLARLVRDGRPLPSDIRWYIAERIEGRIKQRGRPRKHVGVDNLDVVYLEGHAIPVGRSGKRERQAAAQAAALSQLKPEYDLERERLSAMRKRKPSEYKALCEKHRRLGARPQELAYAVIAERDGFTFDAVRNAIKKARRIRH